MNYQSQRFISQGKESLPSSTSCEKSKKHIDSQWNVNHAITYLYLRSKKLERLDAVKILLNDQQRSRCKADTTQRSDGSRSYRLLKPDTNGYTQEDLLKYPMGKSFTQSSDEKDRPTSGFDHQMEAQFVVIDKQQKQKVEDMNALVINSQEDYNFSLHNMSKEQLLLKLKLINQKNEKVSNSPVKYTKYMNHIFLNTVQQHEDEKRYKKRNSQSILTQMGSFKNILHFDEKKFKIQKSHANHVSSQLQIKYTDKMPLLKINDIDDQNQTALILQKFIRRKTQLQQDIFNVSNYLVPQENKNLNSQMSRQKSVKELRRDLKQTQANDSLMYSEINGYIKSQKKYDTSSSSVIELSVIDNLKKNHDEILAKSRKRILRVTTQSTLANSKHAPTLSITNISEIANQSSQDKSRMKTQPSPAKSRPIRINDYYLKK